MTMTSEQILSGPPALLGGQPAFPEKLPLVRPAIPDSVGMGSTVEKILRSGTLTNGPYVRELELRVGDYLGVDHCVAVASCTTGLMLVLRAAGITGEVVVPTFTFSATAHAVAWNGARVRFVDVDPRSLTLSPASMERVIGPDTQAILGVHVYGTPCDVDALSATARRSGLRLFFDAAHAFGSRYKGRPIGGFGDAEVFSLSPTKVLVAGEGGLITTNDGHLAERCRIGRDYGNPGDYDCLFVGLNARMSEVHAAIALASLETIEDQVARRNMLAEVYRGALRGLPGISFPELGDGDRSTYKDFTILVDADDFGMDVLRLAQALEAEGIDSRRYYVPLVHEMRAYRSAAKNNGYLPVSHAVAEKVLTLPMWGGMTDTDPLRVAMAITRIWTALVR